MRIAIASDHGGFELKERIKQYLLEEGHQVEDFGALSFVQDDDYPDYVKPACESILSGKNERGVLICSTGIGTCITANRFKNIRAALVYSENTAQKSREHNDSNVICLGAHEFPYEEQIKFINIWLSTEFAGGRHQRRIEKI
jgi:ribose 5-phosphate isomerase B